VPKPWTRWWWAGQRPFDKSTLTRQLEAIAAAGIGGVEYHAYLPPKGAEDRLPESSSRHSGWKKCSIHTTAKPR
jgi:hypothetical protein